MMLVIIGLSCYASITRTIRIVKGYIKVPLLGIYSLGMGVTVAEFRSPPVFMVFG
jgi:hypothetical protein